MQELPPEMQPQLQKPPATIDEREAFLGYAISSPIRHILRTGETIRTNARRGTALPSNRRIAHVTSPLAELDLF
jgi:hypothetical protein